MRLIVIVALATSFVCVRAAFRGLRAVADRRRREPHRTEPTRAELLCGAGHLVGRTAQ